MSASPAPGRSSGQAQELLLEIARCPVVEACLTDEHHKSPCREIVRHQWPGFPQSKILERWQREHHVPVPWVGHLEEAPILFLSSNPGLGSLRKLEPPAGDPRPELQRLRGATLAEHPSLGRPFEAPKWQWTDEQLVDSYESSFDVWLDGGTRPLIDEEGKLGREVPYWKGVKDIATDILGKPVIAGRDYALTEVVRCKSDDELGVPAATEKCVRLYLGRTLALSPATVVVVLGRKARMVFRRCYAYADADVLSPRLIDVEGRDRRIVFLSHPSAREGGKAKALKYPKRLGADELEMVRSSLANFGPRP